MQSPEAVLRVRRSDGQELCVPLEECHFFGGVVSWVPERSVSRTDPSCSARNWPVDAPPLLDVRAGDDATLVHTAASAELCVRVGSQMHTLRLPPIAMCTPMDAMGLGGAHHLELPDGGALVVRFGEDSLQPEYWRLDVPIGAELGDPVAQRGEQAAIGRMLAVDAIGVPRIMRRRPKTTAKKPTSRSRSPTKRRGSKSPAKKKTSFAGRTSKAVVGGVASAAKATAVSGIVRGMKAAVRAITSEVEMVGAQTKRKSPARRRVSRSRSPMRRRSVSRSPSRRSLSRSPSRRSVSPSPSPSRGRALTRSPSRRSLSPSPSRRQLSKSPSSKSLSPSPSRPSLSKSQSQRQLSKSPSNKSLRPASRTESLRGPRTKLRPSQQAVDTAYVARKSSTGGAKQMAKYGTPSPTRAAKQPKERSSASAGGGGRTYGGLPPSGGMGGGFSGLGFGGGMGSGSSGPLPGDSGQQQQQPMAPVAPAVNVSVVNTNTPAAAAPPPMYAQPVPQPQSGRPVQQVFYVPQAERSQTPSPEGSRSPSPSPPASDDEAVPRVLRALIASEHFGEWVVPVVAHAVENSPEWADLDVHVRDVANIAACRRRN